MSVQLNILPADPVQVASLQQELRLPHFIANTLVARGVFDVSRAKLFLDPSLERDWLDPYLIPGLSNVADVLEQALKAEEHIVVFGDFDLDGISATATLTRALRVLGARVTPFIPRRFEEGYSLTQASIERVLELEPDMVVTVDCGISSKTEAALLVERGVKLVITDHHEPADLVPEGVALADPKLDKDCPSALLAGVGVALKLVQVLGARFGQPHLWREYIDLASLGTIADLMPMISENRALVSEGIKQINARPRPALAALMATAGVAGEEITATNLSFSLIPRLNAAGRMGDAQAALDLLLSDDFEEASRKAAELEAINDQRRSIELTLSEAANKQAQEVYAGQRALVVSGEGWHEGVKGIVASRLVNKYAVPTLLFTIDGEEARGSGRSAGQINLFKAVESLADILTRFGGHEAAVGVTLPTAKLSEFTQRLNKYMNSLPPESFYNRVDVDATVNLEELSLETAASLEQLAPFGQENPTPRFFARDVTLMNCRAVGADKKHLSCVLSDGSQTLPAIMFHCNNIETLMSCGSMVNAAFELRIEEWRGKKTLKAFLISVLPVQACAGLEACLNPDALQFVNDLYENTLADSSEEAGSSKREAISEEDQRKEARRYWQEQVRGDFHALQTRVIEALIGTNELHKAQREALDSLEEGLSTLALMPTSRGKSLIFYVHATCEALLRGTTSLFIYPLRALIADQAFHLRETLAPFGISTEVLNGDTSQEERAKIYERLRAGSCDIVLTTPEFLAAHVQKFAETTKAGFVVLDEAHHIGLAKAGKRPAYAHIDTTIKKLGTPLVLALTATANDEIAQTICDKLAIDQVVIDRAVRSNLQINDQRNLKQREAYLASLIAQGEKTVIYVNSREQSIVLARMMRKSAPHMASLIGFYNAGLTRAERRRIEELFRTDELCVLVATSAFGEGVNIPNIRNVVLYHLPFSEVEFNQMSGRAGRDGNPAIIHLLFGRKDAATNENILLEKTPEHDCMAQIYRTLRHLQKESVASFLLLGNEDIAQCASKDQRFCVSKAQAECGVAVFRELKLIETQTSYEQGTTKRGIRVCESVSKVELIDSVRYREGLEEREIFRSFKKWILGSPKDVLEVRISRAILPRSFSRDIQQDEQNNLQREEKR